MIVQKPQFDTDEIKKGQAYWIESFNRYNKLYDPCLIENVSPFTIEVMYYNSTEKEMDTLKITIDEVVGKKITLTPLIKKEENKIEEEQL
jgi:hypothetical protein